MKLVTFMFLALMLVFALPAYAVAQDLDAQSAKIEDQSDHETIVVVGSRIKRASRGISPIAVVPNSLFLPVQFDENEEPVEYTNQPEYSEAVESALRFHVELNESKHSPFCYRRDDTRSAVRSAIRRTCRKRLFRSDLNNDINDIFITQDATAVAVATHSNWALGGAVSGALYRRGEGGAWVLTSEETMFWDE